MQSTDPQVAYPTVWLGDTEYTVKFTAGSIIRLKRDYGIELDSLAGQQLKGADAIEKTCKLLAAGISHAVTMDVQEVADKIDLQDLGKYSAAVVEALKKAAPQTETKLAVAAVVQ